ncbi:MAG: hypothetical protein JMM75_00370 [Candidatus Xiphinematobacter sp.]|nr:MAG: hypothetical protein JMM75_00370 [Candidatus Xiphinematobacter sp.]
MPPILLFAFWLTIVVLLGWYCMEDLAGRRPALGLILSGLLISFCLQQVWPPSKKIPLGLDLRGGSSFLIKLVHLPGQLYGAASKTSGKYLTESTPRAGRG